MIYFTLSTYTIFFSKNKQKYCNIQSCTKADDYETDVKVQTSSSTRKSMNNYIHYIYSLNYPGIAT